MTKGAKLARALALRDAALKVLGRVGSWEAVGVNRKTSDAGDVKVLAAHLSGLHISYRTPFQHMPQAVDLLKYRAAQFGLTVPQNLPYGLDVWAPKKVASRECSIKRSAAWLAKPRHRTSGTHRSSRPGETALRRMQRRCAGMQRHCDRMQGRSPGCSGVAPLPTARAYRIVGSAIRLQRLLVCHRR